MLLFTMQHIVNRPGLACNPSFEFLTQIFRQKAPRGSRTLTFMPADFGGRLLDR